MAKKITYADLTDEQKRARSKADAKWKKDHMTQISFKLHNVIDADIIEALLSSGNKSAYLKELIRADIKRKSEDGAAPQAD